MKVYISRCQYDHSAGLVLVASRTLDEAVVTAKSDNYTSRFYDMWEYDEESRTWLLPDSCPMSMFEEVAHLSYDSDTPAVIDADVYLDYD